MFSFLFIQFCCLSICRLRQNKLGSHRAVLGQSSGSHGVVVGQLPSSRCAVMQLSACCQAVIRQSLSSHQEVIRQSSGSCLFSALYTKSLFTLLFLFFNHFSYESIIHYRLFIIRWFIKLNWDDLLPPILCK